MLVNKHQTPFIFPSDIPIEDFLRILAYIDSEAARNWGTILDVMHIEVFTRSFCLKLGLFDAFTTRIQQVRNFIRTQEEQSYLSVREYKLATGKEP